MWLYPLLILAGSCSLAAVHRDPQDDVDDLVLTIRDAERRLFYRAGAANVGLFPGRGWTLTVYVGDTRRYGPGTFLVLTRLDGRLAGELLSEPYGESGAMGRAALSGTSLDVYLRRAGLDLSGLDAAVVARFKDGPRPR
jgi:hypothetical protein